MNAKTIEIILAASAAFALSGAEVRTDHGSSSGGTSIMNVATWGIEAFSSEDDYIIAHGGVSVVGNDRDASGTITFPGNSLHLQQSFQPSIDANYTLAFPRAGLFFDANGILRSWITGSSRTVTVTGTCITVTSPSSNPAKLLATSVPAQRTTYDFRAPLVGASGTQLLMRQYSNANYPGKSTLRLLNDCSTFYGTIRLDGNDSELVVGTESFSGKVWLRNETSGTATLAGLDGVNSKIAEVVGDNAPVTIRVPISRTFTVGNLTMAGGTISFSAADSGMDIFAGVVEVTNALNISSPVTIRYPAAAAVVPAAPFADLAAAVTVMTLPVGKGTLSTNDFVLAVEAQPTLCGDLPHDPYLAVRTVDGVQHLVVAYDELHGGNLPLLLDVPAGQTVTVGDLRMGGGSITFAAGGAGTNSYAGVMAVTNSLDVSSPVTIRYPAAAAAFRAAPLDDLAAAVTVLTLPAGKGTLSAVDFTLEIQAQPEVCGSLPRNPYLAVRTVDGVQRLVVAYDQPVVVLLTTDNSVNGGSSFKEANKGRWSDGEVPGPGKHCFIPYGIQVMTLSGVEFTAESMTVAGILAICATPFNVKDLTLLGGSDVYDYVDNPTVNGTVAVYGSDTIDIRPQATHTLTFTGEVSGSAPLRLLYYEQGNVGKNTWVRFSHANPSYSGKISFSTANTVLTESWTNGTACLRLNVADPLELGGPLPAFAYDALALSSRMGVSALDSMTFNDQTRGVLVGTNGRVDVPEGKQLAFAQPFTWCGVLRKYGAGTFAVGGPAAPMFFWQNDFHDTPTTADVANRMSVMEGGLKVLTTNALDGCELEIKSGASLVLDANPADADVRTYGFVNAKWDAPFLLSDGMTTVPVTFDFGGEEPSFAQRTLGICTVKSDATGVSKSLFAPVRPKHYDVKVLSEANAATGLTTYSVQLVREGFLVIFR